MTAIRTALATALLTLAAAAHAGPVNINTAAAPELAEELVGVGPVVAARIVSWREAHGEFRAPADLVAVRGVGERTLERNRDNIVVK